jgi:hypothetical protein
MRSRHLIRDTGFHVTCKHFECTHLGSIPKPTNTLPHACSISRRFPTCSYMQHRTCYPNIVTVHVSALQLSLDADDLVMKAKELSQQLLPTSTAPTLSPHYQPQHATILEQQQAEQPPYAYDGALQQNMYGYGAHINLYEARMAPPLPDPKDQALQLELEALKAQIAEQDCEYPCGAQLQPYRRAESSLYALQTCFAKHTKKHVR